MINLTTRIILVTSLCYLITLVVISNLALIPMNNIINDKLFKLGNKPSHLEFSPTTNLWEGQRHDLIDFATLHRRPASGK